MFKEIQISSLRLKLVAGLIVATAIGLASFGASAQTGFTTINVSGAGTGAQQGTAVTAVDAAGDITGVYIDSNNALHCFVSACRRLDCKLRRFGCGLERGTRNLSHDHQFLRGCGGNVC